MQLYKLRGQFGIFILLASLSVWACKHNSPDGENPIDMPSLTEGVVQLKYTAEITTHVNTKSPNGQLTGLEEIASMPKVKKTEVAMVVYADGTCEMTKRELTPSRQLVTPNDLTPPSTRPVGVLTRVDRQGHVRVFDKDNKEIRTFTMNQPLNMSDWLVQIKKDREAADATQAITYMFGNKTAGVRPLLEEVRRSGGIIDPKSDGTLLVRMGSVSNGLGMRNADNVFTESIIDTTQNVVRAAAVFDRVSNKMLSRMAYTYQDVSGSRQLTHIYMESMNPQSPADRQKRMISVTQLSNVTFRINP